MSLLLAYTFNDNNASSFADFSGNKQTGSGTITGMVAGQNYGYAANLNATNNYITVTPSNFSGISALTVFASIYITSLPVSPGVYYLINQSGSFNIKINSGGNVVFSVKNLTSGLLVTLTSATSLSATTWYTLACVADGSNMYIYINGTQDSNTIANTGIAINNNAIYIGNDTSSDTTSTFKGYIDNIEVRSTAGSAVDMSNLNSSPGGLAISNVSHNFATGDLLLDLLTNNEAVVTWVVDTSNFYIYPVSGTPISYSRIGNIYQTARQYFMKQSNDFDGNGNGQIATIGPISGFADYSTAPTITFDYRGIIGAANLLSNIKSITSLRI